MKQETAITPTRKEDYAEWYQQVIKAAELADQAPVRGCMVIRPWGFKLWENIQAHLDCAFKKTGVENGYFPLFIPLTYMQKEAEHIAGFAKECAVVTHYRLKVGSDGKLAPDPESKLEEPLIVRPTSEMIIGEMFAGWVQSHRDLPLLMNQWCNVVRWEMRTRIFLRTSEFLWQEGHTAHATEEQAQERTMQMLEIYRECGEKLLAIPFLKGKKTPSERFPGAEETYTIEAMMQDGKALQAGTSHFLGQKFAKGSNIRFQNKDGQMQYAYTTSWGTTTRLIGALIMTHSDDDGLVLPPKIAPIQLVIIPIIKEETKEIVLQKCREIKERLESKSVLVHIDEREERSGSMMWYWIKKGIPFHLSVGAKDIEKKEYALFRRDSRAKENVSIEDLDSTVLERIDTMQKEMYEKALAMRLGRTKEIKTKEEFYAFFKSTQSGFALCHWNGKEDVEKQVQEDLGVSIRCIPLDEPPSEGVCVISGEKSTQRVIFAKSY